MFLRAVSVSGDQRAAFQLETAFDDERGVGFNIWILEDVVALGYTML